MGLFGLVMIFAVLAVVTQIGVFAFERMYPPHGQFVDVAGARLHVVDIGPRDTRALPVVMIPGASSSLETMRYALGDALAKNHRVILIDRPGQGWSTRERREDSSTAIQARMIDEALGKLGITRAVVVGHSLAGAIVPKLALDDPQRVAGIVLLSPALYRWPGGVGLINKIATWPVVGPLLAYTAVLPSGWFMTDSALDYVFSPQPVPKNFAQATQVPLVLRPQAFLNNAWDLETLKASVTDQSSDYPKIRVPVTLIAGGADNVVSTSLHSEQFARNVSQAKLIVLPGVGHMPYIADTDLVVREIEAVIAQAQSTRVGVAVQQKD